MSRCHRQPFAITVMNPCTTVDGYWQTWVKYPTSSECFEQRTKYGVRYCSLTPSHRNQVASQVHRFVFEPENRLATQFCAYLLRDLDRREPRDDRLDLDRVRDLLPPCGGGGGPPPRPLDRLIAAGMPSKLLGLAYLMKTTAFDSFRPTK